jgi:ATP-binding cassette subfamily B multidrug efflux pump
MAARRLPREHQANVAACDPGRTPRPWYARAIRDSNRPVVSEPRANSDLPRPSPWGYLRPYRGRVMLGVVMLVATNVIFLGEPILIGRIVDALAPAAEQAGDSRAAVTSLVDGVVDAIAQVTHLDRVPVLALLLIAVAIGTGFTRILSRVYLFNTAREAEADVRRDLFARLLRFEPGYYRAHPTGDVMSRLTNDVQTVRGLWGPGVLNIVNTAVAFATVLVMMIWLDPWITLLALLPYPSMFLLGRLFGRRLYRFSHDVQVQLGKLSASIQEDLTGIGIIKSYGLEDQRQSHFGAMSVRLLDSNMALTRVRTQLIPVLTAVSSLGTVIVLWAGAGGRITPGELAEFLTYLGRLVWPTLALGWMLSLIQRGMASWKRLQEVLIEEPRIQDGRGPDLDLAEIRGDLSLRGLTIAIDGRKVLDDVHLEMPAGTVTAIVGRTGAGKSTLVEALPRLIEVPPGTVFLDGRDITELSLGTLRRAIGYAPQETFLFSTTIARNIAFGYERYGEAAARGGKPRAKIGARPDTSPDGRPEAKPDAAPEPRMARAAIAAGLARDIEALPAGYDTVVGERGITLSGGQRQRVALARALAAAPRVLILDDSLSSVDAETEREILGHLTEIMAGRTAILISHRVAAVKRADQIVCLDQGKVVEIGTHDELLAAGGLYAEVYRSQLEAHDEDVIDAPGESEESGGAPPTGSTPGNAPGGAPGGNP